MIKENLTHLIALIEGIPDNAFGLERYQSECGSVFCTLGHAANNPRYQAQGLSWGSAAWTKNPVVKINGKDPVEERSLDTIFGEYAFDNLFTTRDNGNSDYSLQEAGELTDKSLALARLHKQLEQYK